MRIDGTHYRSIWMDDHPGTVKVIDQRVLPFEFRILELKSSDDAFHGHQRYDRSGGSADRCNCCLRTLPGCLPKRSGPTGAMDVQAAAEKLISARPTAVNLKYAVDLLMEKVLCAGFQGVHDQRAFSPVHSFCRGRGNPQ